jgi:hypothetical protein
MDFLRDDGLEIGCFANRYMTVVDASGRTVEKSFGMSWWKSLAALERWAESHPTHVAIFGAAMKYLGTMGPAAKLKLYHEVTVAAAGEQLRILQLPSQDRHAAQRGFERFSHSARGLKSLPILSNGVQHAHNYVLH